MRTKENTQQDEKAGTSTCTFTMYPRISAQRSLVITNFQIPIPRRQVQVDRREISAPKRSVTDHFPSTSTSDVPITRPSRGNANTWE